MKVIDSTVAFPKSVGNSCVEVLNVAVSPGLTGAIPDAQLAPAFQLSVSGAGNQTALTASAGVDAATARNNPTRSARTVALFLPGSLGRRVETLISFVFIAG